MPPVVASRLRAADVRHFAGESTFHQVARAVCTADAAIARKLAEELRDTKDELERLKRSYARAADDGAKARRLLADANQALRNEREKAPTGAALSQLLDGLPPAVAARVIQELRATVSVYSGFGARYGL